MTNRIRGLLVVAVLVLVTAVGLGMQKHGQEQTNQAVKVAVYDYILSSQEADAKAYARYTGKPVPQILAELCPSQADVDRLSTLSVVSPSEVHVLCPASRSPDGRFSQPTLFTVRNYDSGWRVEDAK